MIIKKRKAIYICDRCGKLTLANYDQKHGYLRKAGGWGVIINNKNQSLDLCPQCMSEFGRWMNSQTANKERRFKDANISETDCL